MPPRLLVSQPFTAGAVVALPSAAVRHVQVLRLQPGDAIIVFNGAEAAEWPAEIVRIGRQAVDVRLGEARAVDRELPLAVTLAVGVPANDRMDALVEKAGELGAAAIQPLVCSRSVLRLAGDRADARRARWSGVAAAASEQCGRARVTEVLPLLPLAAWLEAQRAAPAPVLAAVLSFDPASLAPGEAFAAAIAALGARPRPAAVVLSGPEGGLDADEELRAVGAGFVRVGLGPRVLRADTAPLALLAWLGLQASRSEGRRP